MTPKYAPADAKGQKPWVVTHQEWGKEKRTVVYAPTPQGAKYRAMGRRRHGMFLVGIRRARPEEVAP